MEYTGTALLVAPRYAKEGRALEEAGKQWGRLVFAGADDRVSA